MSFLQWVRRMLSQNVRYHPSKPWDPLIHNADFHLKREEYDEARIILLKALEFRDDIKEPATIDYLLASLGCTWLFTEKYDDGIQFFSDYIGRHSQDAAAYDGRAGIRWYAGQLDRAVDDYSRALELNADDISSLSGRGQIFAEIGQGPKAIEDLDLALLKIRAASKPDPAWIEWYRHTEAFVHNGPGTALAALGQNASAMKAFEISISLSPENAWVYYNRARAYEAVHDRDRASADYRMALTKKEPALNPIQKSRAQSRLRELSSN
jgi:tetratricopeptide (TPR) repeat protein